MSQVIAQISISLDGFVAGPNQGQKNPLGEGGERLHQWAFPTESWLEPIDVVASPAATHVKYRVVR